MSALISVLLVKAAKGTVDTFSRQVSRKSVFFSNDERNSHEGKLIKDSHYLIEGNKLIGDSHSNARFVVHEEIVKGNFIGLYPELDKVKESGYSSSVICALGYKKFMENKYKDIAEIEPFYLQPFAGVL